MANINVDQVLSQMRQLTAASQGVQNDISNNNAVGKTGFSELLKTSIDKVNATQMEAGKLSESFSAGNPAVELSDVMISLQKASVSFQAMTEVRNRLVDAYRDIMNMQL
jgi:flagellar hook-basal body complex protein FliE